MFLHVFGQVHVLVVHVFFFCARSHAIVSARKRICLCINVFQGEAGKNVMATATEPQKSEGRNAKN